MITTLLSNTEFGPAGIARFRLRFCPPIGVPQSAIVIETVATIGMIKVTIPVRLGPVRINAINRRINILTVAFDDFTTART